MTDKSGMLLAYRKVCSLKDYLELIDERGEHFSRSQVEALVGKIGEAFQILERRKSGR